MSERRRRGRGRRTGTPSRTRPPVTNRQGDIEDLQDELQRIDGRPYPAYRDITGTWSLGDGWTLLIDKVQGDPFASPSRLRMRTSSNPVPDGLREGVRRQAAEDRLLRELVRALGRTGHRRGSGGSGRITCHEPGQKVLGRTAVRIQPGGQVEFRVRVGLPAAGRRILGREAEELLLDDLWRAAEQARDSCTDDVLVSWADHVAGQSGLRAQLRDRGLVAFIPDGAVLARASGVDERPM